jgi:hypothetical protein
MFGSGLFLGTLGHLAIVSGIVLMIAWAIKHLSSQKLKHAALWCIGLGAVLTIATTLFMGSYGMRKSFMFKTTDGSMMDSDDIQFMMKR